MDKLYFKKNLLIRIEHFGILLLSLDGKRFSISKKFKNILYSIEGTNTNVLIEKFGKQLGNDKTIKLIESLLARGLLMYSSKKLNSNVKIIENDFISKDALSFPRTVYWELTQLCNLSCIHCYSNGMVKGFKGLPFDIIKNTIDELVEKGVEFLNIGGGEPLIYKDIYKVLKYAIGKGLMIEMTTNGTLINEQSIKKLKETGLKFIQISLDGANKQIYEKIRVGATFERVIDSIKLLVSSGFIVSVNTVLMKYNQGDEINIIELCKDIGVSYFKVSPLMETGRGSINMNEIQMSLVDYKETYKKLLKYKESHKEEDMQIIIYQNILKPEVKNISWMPEDHFGCPAGRTTCAIDSFGNVYPCSYMNHKELVCGNIVTQPLGEIWATSDIMIKMRNIEKLSGKCSSCNFLKLCRGGCRAMAYLRHQKIDASDPLCVVNI